MLRAVKEFVHNEGNGSLPVRGTIPDMIADSQKFINLQNVWVGECLGSSCVNAKTNYKMNQVLPLLWLNDAYLFCLFNLSYREKSLQDAAAVSKHVESLLQSIGKVYTHSPSLTVQDC